jgi:hypothetical protein
MATAKQIKVIKAIQRDKFSSDEEYRDWLRNNFKVTSCTKLNNQEASEAIQLLTEGKIKPVTPAKYRGNGKRGSQVHLTPAQAERIRILEEILDWHSNGRRLQGFMKRIFNRETRVDWLKNYEAVKLILGMTKLISGKDETLFKKLNSMNNSELQTYRENL